MAQSMRIALEDRGILAVTGPDAREFLQGIVTNDIDKVDRARSIYAALLTPQGKFLFDFFICEDGSGGLLLDTRLDRIESLAQRLDFYRLRAKVDIPMPAVTGALPRSSGTGQPGWPVSSALRAMRGMTTGASS